MELTTVAMSILAVSFQLVAAPSVDPDVMDSRLPQFGGLKRSEIDSIAARSCRFRSHPVSRSLLFQLPEKM